jgi:hypothetical protein
MKRFLVLAVVCLQLTGCQTLMPTAEKPYELGLPAPSAAASAGWTWIDARPSVNPLTSVTPAGLVFGDAVMRPRPFEAVQTEFARAVAAHEASAEILEKIRGKVLKLQDFESSVGLWARLSERQQSNWEFVRVRMTVDVDGKTYEALDVHRFNNSDQPSPVSIPLRKAVENLVQQILLF